MENSAISFIPILLLSSYLVPLPFGMQTFAGPPSRRCLYCAAFSSSDYSLALRSVCLLVCFPYLGSEVIEITYCCTFDIEKSKHFCKLDLHVQSWFAGCFFFFTSRSSVIHNKSGPIRYKLLADC